MKSVKVILVIGSFTVDSFWNRTLKPISHEFYIHVPFFFLSLLNIYLMALQASGWNSTAKSSQLAHTITFLQGFINKITLNAINISLESNYQIFKDLMGLIHFIKPTYTNIFMNKCFTLFCCISCTHYLPLSLINAYCF